MEHFVVGIELEGKHHSASFTTCFGYLLKMRSSIAPHQSDFDTIINELCPTYLNVRKVQVI